MKFMLSFIVKKNKKMWGMRVTRKLKHNLLLRGKHGREDVTTPIWRISFQQRFQRKKNERSRKVNACHPLNVNEK